MATDTTVSDYGAWTLIGIERDRQIQDLAYTEAHDDAHIEGEIAIAAACYAAASRGDAIYLANDNEMPYRVSFEDAWPWEVDDDKRIRDAQTDERRVKIPEEVDQRIRLLVKAGALICAEIDRLMRARAIDGSDHIHEPPPVQGAGSLIGSRCIHCHTKIRREGTAQPWKLLQ